MAVFHIILRHFALVHFLLFCEKIDRKAFLKERSTLILFILEDALHRAGRPVWFSRRSGNPICRQFLCNGAWCQALHETGVYSADNDRFFRHDLRKTVHALSVTKELLVWQIHLAVGKPLSLTPGHILRNGTAFFLRKARHDGQQQFAFAVKGVDVFFFKIDLYAFFLQLADGDQAVDRISGKSADRFRDDEVHLAGHGIVDHLIEASAVLGACTGNALVGIDLYKLPFGIALDVLRVVVDLGFIAGELLIAVCGYSGVSGDPSFSGGRHRNMRQRIDGRWNDCNRPN